MTVEQPEDVRLDPPVSEIWTKTLVILSKQLSQPSFDSWIRPIQLSGLTGDQAVITVANEFHKSWIVNKHLNEIEEALSQVIGRPINVTLNVDSSALVEYTPSIASIAVIPQRANPSEAKENQAQVAADLAARQGNSGLNPKYVFDTFVVGGSNLFCHSAALAVADRPGQAYNPLFIYGDVGLGKTHLLQAIGNQVLKKSPNMVIRYMTCERFTNDVINSIRDDRMIEFRKRYRQVDVLLVDDIQFIERKESTQEEFFHTFNALRESGKQIVLSSDRPPKSLSHLEERLRSRFEWGLIADIQAPNYEMRLAILQRKATEENLDVPASVLEYIANLFNSNIRELEGALLRACAFSKLTGAPLTPAAICEVLQPGGPKKDKRNLTIERLIDTVASYYHLEPAELKSAKRSQDLTVPRHMAMYLAHEVLSLSFPRVGQSFGNRKHTSALYAYDKVKTAIPEDPEIAKAVREITRLLGD
ncbi:MAG: chromosomal replication initiator protein DnaA [Candidatus Obscuribacterales bacterium]|nr:chromosomal replication initiator protein DnaA [Candidatus Obscuribacterales bacterium]